MYYMPPAMINRVNMSHLFLVTRATVMINGDWQVLGIVDCFSKRPQTSQLSSSVVVLTSAPPFFLHFCLCGYTENDETVAPTSETHRKQCYLSWYFFYLYQLWWPLSSFHCSFPCWHWTSTVLLTPSWLSASPEVSGLKLESENLSEWTRQPTGICKN